MRPSPALGVPGPTLMANAGRAVARAIQSGGSARAARWCSPDPATMAATAMSPRGCCSRRAGRSPWPRSRRRARVPMPPMPRRSWRGPSAPFTPTEAARAELVIDAVFGAGLARDVDGVVADALRAARRVVAVDVPSGVDGGTGAVRGYAPQAALTVTLLPAQARASSAAGPRAVRRDGAGRYRLAQRRAARCADRPASPTCRSCGACRRPGRSRTNIRAAMSPWWVARR